MANEDDVNYPSEEQGIEKDAVSLEEEKERDASGESEEDVYDEAGVELEGDDDEITPSEQGFMKGYSESVKKKKKRD